MNGRSRRPKLEDHNAAQREYFKAADKHTMLPEDTPYNRRQAAELADFAGLKGGERVLEVGCGMGRHTFILARRGLQMEGLDLSPQLIQRMQAFDGGQYNIRTHVGDLLEYASEFRGSFDAVIGFFMLHHLYENLSQYFVAMAGMLKPGGRIAFMEPNPYNLLYYLQIFLTPGMKWQAERGILNMRTASISAAAQAAGFQALSVRRFGFFPRAIANTGWGRSLDSALENVGIWRGLLPFQIFVAHRPL